MKIINFLKKYWQILLVIVLGLVPIGWYKSEFIIATGDAFPLWFNSLKTTFYDNFLWNSANAGQISTSPQYDIYAISWYLLQIMHIAINKIQIFFETFYFWGAGLAMYFLASTIYKKQKIIAFIASIFYMFNFFMLLKTPTFGISWTMVFLPILLAFYIKIIDNIKNNQKTASNSIGFAIISMVLMSFASINPPLLAMIFITIFIVFVYYFITEKNIRSKIIQNLFVLSFVVFFINLWWLSTFLLNLYNLNLVTGSQINAVIYVWTHARASFLNLFWLNGSWGWTPTYIPYIDAYSNPIMIFIVFIPMIIAFIVLLFRTEYRKINLYFAVVILILMFLAKGLHPPFENINLFFYKYIPGFYLFRTPFSLYMILIIFLALLIGSSSDSIIYHIQSIKIKYKKIISMSFTVGIIAVFLISTFPLITGDVITKGTKDLPFSAYVKIPDFWYQTAQYFNNIPGDFRILITPENDGPYMAYKWGYEGSDSLPSRLIVKPVLQQSYGYGVNSRYTGIMTATYGAMNNGSTVEFYNLLTLLNVKYILQRNDIISSMNMTAFLSKQTNIQLEKSFGEHDIYKISDTYYTPHIYTSSSPIMVPTFNDFLMIINSSSFTPEQNIMILNQNQNKIIPKINNTKLPEIFFEKINPTKFEVKIESAREPFYLVFSESYDPDWLAYINTDAMQCSPIVTYSGVNITECQPESKFFEIRDITRIFGESIPEDNHFVVNGYANAWYIDPKELGTGKNFTITLYFKPQSYFYIGLIISGLTFIGFVGYLLWDWRKEGDINSLFKRVGGR